ncbi:MAG: YhjD/YihY/BrkB family envelope integrity protein, partial [Verrucomicrobiota bacterium]
MSEPLLRRVARAVRGLSDADLGTLSPGRRAIAYTFRLASEAVRELLAASFLMRAAALAFSTLLALVPLVVVISGVTAGLFPRQSDQVLDRVASLLVPARDSQQRASSQPVTGAASLPPAGQEDVLVAARASLRRQLEGIRTHAGGINLVGFLILLYTVLSLLDSVEDSLNVVWHVRKARRWMEKLPYYIAILFLAPIFIVLSISLTTTLEAIGVSAAHIWLVPSWARGAPGFLLKHVTPVLLMGLSLWVTYLWMPIAK